MATNKNQHFVPRCHLRPFTQGEEGKAIRIFNIDREHVIENAAVKHQCSGSYFYGEDERLESALQLMEQGYSSVLRKVRMPEFRKLSEDDALVLKRFWLLQYLRTEAASKRAVEMNNDLGELVGENSSFRMEIREAVLIAMHTFAREMGAIDDLSTCLVKNSTNLSLITSDDPAVLTNRWFKTDRRHRAATFGLGGAGALAILPLSEDMALIAYDSDVYSIPKKAGIVKTKYEGDIRALNDLQFLNCRANIFPGQVYEGEALCEDFRQCEGNRLSERHRFHYSIRDRVEGDYERYRVIEHPSDEEHTRAIVHLQTLSPDPIRWPRFIRWRKKGFGMTNGTGVGCIRRSFTVGRNGPPFKKMHTGY